MSMVQNESKVKKSSDGFMSWIDDRFPATETFEYHMSRYPAPKNFNFFYYFGVLATVVFVLQILTGIWLTMNYCLLYTSPSPRDRQKSRMPSSA